MHSYQLYYNKANEYDACKRWTTILLHFINKNVLSCTNAVNVR